MSSGLGETPFDTGWQPGYAAGRLVFDSDAVRQVKIMLERRTEEMQEFSAGTPASLRAAARDLFSVGRFGRWRLALDLRRMQAAAVHGSIAIERALVANLTSFTLILGQIFGNYDLSEEASSATILRLSRELDVPGGHRAGGQPAVGRPVGLAVPPAPGVSFQPGPGGAGRLWIPRSTAEPDPLDHDPDELSGEVRRLAVAQAWEAHYRLSQAFRAASDFHDVLGKSLRRSGAELATAWNGEASVHARDALERIWRTVRTHESDLSTLRGLSNATGEALETLRGRWTVGFRVLATNLSGRYLEVIQAYPESLDYDLPFDRPPEPEREPEVPALARRRPPVTPVGDGDRTVPSGSGTGLLGAPAGWDRVPVLTRTSSILDADEEWDGTPRWAGPMVLGDTGTDRLDPFGVLGEPAR